MERYDVIVVGAGPAGLRTAELIAKEGYNVGVLEEHSEIGSPAHCSGLFSVNIINEVGKMGVLHPAKYAYIHSPAGNTIKIGDGRIRAYVVDRVEFDRKLASKALSVGADLLLKERVKNIKYPEIYTSSKKYKANIIIGADGINSVVRKNIGIKSPPIISAAQVIAQTEYENESTVEIFLGSDIALGFFGWKIPLFDGLAKIGVGAYGASVKYLNRLIKKIGAKPLSISASGIPVGFAERTYDRGVILIGDAAGHVKATSGGGVYPSLRIAKIASDVVIQALEKGDYSRDFLAKYEELWKKDIGKELKKAQWIHKIYRKIKDVEFDKIIEMLNSEEIIDTINKYGDIDYPSKVAWKILKKKPTLLRYINIPARLYRKHS